MVSTQFVCMRESTKELEQESTTFLNAALHSTDSIKVKVMCLVRSGVIVGQSVVTAYSLVNVVTKLVVTWSKLSCGC